MIDLSTLKEGDVCVLRCGGRLPITQSKNINYIGGFLFSDWNAFGLHEDSTYFDIISIERAPEPRKMIEYCAFQWGFGILEGIRTLENAKVTYPTADKYFKVTIIEGKKPEIEEIE